MTVSKRKHLVTVFALYAVIAFLATMLLVSQIHHIGNFIPQDESGSLQAITEPEAQFLKEEEVVVIETPTEDPEKPQEVILPVE